MEISHVVCQEVVEHGEIYYRYGSSNMVVWYQVDNDGDMRLLTTDSIADIELRYRRNLQ